MGIGSVCYSEPRSPGTICWPLLQKINALLPRSGVSSAPTSTILNDQVKSSERTRSKLFSFADIEALYDGHKLQNNLLWNTGRRKAWQQKRHTPSKLRHCGHRLWLRLRDDRSEEKGKKKSQPSTPEAETNRTPEREDNDQGYNDFVEDSHCQSRRRRGGGRTSSCPALTAATSLLGTASRASAWPCLKLTGAVCKIAKVWNQFEDVNKLIRHVVNCVQPHPTLPLIATSGIDYDVKVVPFLTLWLNILILRTSPF